MGFGDCVKCVKYLLFVFNFIFCLIGLAILAFGIFVYVSPKYIIDFSDQEGLPKFFEIVGIIIIVIGSIITVLGFLGCCGAIFENRVLLVLFFVLLLLIFLGLLTIGICGVIFKDNSRAAFESDFADGIKATENSTNRKYIDAFQELWLCCGWKNGEKDYTDSGQAVPPSCHHNTTKPAVSCSKRYDDGIGKQYVWIVVATFVTAAISLLGLVFSMMLCCAITELA